MPMRAFHSRRQATGHFVGHFTGEQCRQLRTELELTQAELAEVAGVGERSLRRFERGKIRSRAVTVESLFGALRRFREDEMAKLKGAA